MTKNNLEKSFKEMKRFQEQMERIIDANQEELTNE